MKTKNNYELYSSLYKNKLIADVYHGILQRDPDESGLLHYGEKFDEQGIAGTIKSLLNSTEGRRNFIRGNSEKFARELYNAAFSEQPNDKTLRKISDHIIQNGITDSVRAIFAGKFQTPKNIIDQWCHQQLIPWITKERVSFKKTILKFKEWNENDPDIYLYKIKDGEVRILRKDHKNELLKHHHERALVYRGFFQRILNSSQIPLETIFAVCVRDEPKMEVLDYPLFSFEKSRGSNLILLPDIDFLNSDFYISEKYADKKQFCEKSTTAVFVGATTGAERIDGIRVILKEKIKNLPRIKSALFFKDHPDVIFELPKVVHAKSAEVEEEIRRLDLGGAIREWSEQFDHKFIISMDGNGATCSRVAIALRSNSVLMKYESERVLFYFNSLIPWLHYIPVSHDQEVEKIIQLEKIAPGEFESIAENGKKFAVTHLNQEVIESFTFDLLKRHCDVYDSLSDSDITESELNEFEVC